MEKIIIGCLVTSTALSIFGCIFSYHAMEYSDDARRPNSCTNIDNGISYIIDTNVNHITTELNDIQHKLNNIQFICEKDTTSYDVVYEGKYKLNCKLK